MDLSIHILLYIARSPKSLIWPGNKALLWAQEAKGMSSAASPPHFFIFFCSPCPNRYKMRFLAIGALLSSYFFIGRFGWTSPFFPNGKWKGLYHIEMSIRFPPQMRWA